MWSDGTKMPLPSDTWGHWDEGQPDDLDGEDCSILTNYAFWEDMKTILDAYVWRDYTCKHNPINEIQGYVCESQSFFC